MRPDVSIVAVGNVSTDPFRLAVPAFATHKTWTTPNGVCEAVGRGLGDIVLLPTACAAQFSHRFEPAPFGVAAIDSMPSVQLFSNAARELLAGRDHGIFITGESQTSRLLLRLLWEQQFGTRPVEVASRQAASAFLMIGDHALLEARRRRWNFSVDLCTWWHEMFGLPFVFARWYFAKSVSTEVRSDAMEWLEQCCQLADSPEGMSRLLKRALRDELFETKLQGEEYFRNLISRLDASCDAAELHFSRLLEEQYA